MASSLRSGNFSTDIGTTGPSLLQYFETDKYCLVGLHRYKYSYNFKTWFTVPKKRNITNITFGIPSALECQTSCATLNPQRTIHLPFSVIYTTLLSWRHDMGRFMKLQTRMMMNDDNPIYANVYKKSSPRRQIIRYEMVKLIQLYFQGVPLYMKTVKASLLYVPIWALNFCLFL
jgi:hypothetical protein